MRQHLHGLRSSPVLRAERHRAVLLGNSTGTVCLQDAHSNERSSQPLPGGAGGGAKAGGYAPEAWGVALNSAFSFFVSL